MNRIELREDEKIYLEYLHQSAKKMDAVATSIAEAIERGTFGKSQ